MPDPTKDRPDAIAIRTGTVHASAVYDYDRKFSKILGGQVHARRAGAVMLLTTEALLENTPGPAVTLLFPADHPVCPKAPRLDWFPVGQGVEFGYLKPDPALSPASAQLDADGGFVPAAA